MAVANGWVDGQHILPQDMFTWPVPVVLQIRRWHADATITQLCFEAGWQRPSRAVFDLEERMHQAMQQFNGDPAYAEFKKFHGNLVLYTSGANKLDPDPMFVARCREIVTAEYPGWTEVKEWLYASNSDGWTILLRKPEK
jgi:hypothetical protein